MDPLFLLEIILFSNHSIVLFNFVKVIIVCLQAGVIADFYLVMIISFSSSMYV